MQRRDTPIAEKISWLLFLSLAGTSGMIWLYLAVNSLMRG